MREHFSRADTRDLAFSSIKSVWYLKTNKQKSIANISTFGIGDINS